VHIDTRHPFDPGIPRGRVSLREATHESRDSDVPFVQGNVDVGSVEPRVVGESVANVSLELCVAAGRAVREGQGKVHLLNAGHARRVFGQEVTLGRRICRAP